MSTIVWSGKRLGDTSLGDDASLEYSHFPTSDTTHRPLGFSPFFRPPMSYRSAFPPASDKPARHSGFVACWRVVCAIGIERMGLLETTFRASDPAKEFRDSARLHRCPCGDVRAITDATATTEPNVFT
jgi:hypothetical protein